LEGTAAQGKPFLELAYGYMPLVWAGTLSHYLLPLLSEAGRILPVRASPPDSSPSETPAQSLMTNAPVLVFVCKLGQQHGPHLH
jgi:hypothetical protein